MSAFDRTVREYLSFLDNDYISAAVAISLVTYASHAAPRLPAYVTDLFEYNLFRFVMFFLIAYHMGTRSPTVAAFGALLFLVVVMSLNRVEISKYVSSASSIVGGTLLSREDFEPAEEDERSQSAPVM